MSRKYKFRDQSKLYFVSFATVHWIDLFVRPEYSDILLDGLRYCQKEKGLEIYGWCIMPSHVHLIIGSDNRPMQDMLRDFKSHSSYYWGKAKNLNGITDEGCKLLLEAKKYGYSDSEVESCN